MLHGLVGETGASRIVVTAKDEHRADGVEEARLDELESAQAALPTPRCDVGGGLTRSC